MPLNTKITIDVLLDDNRVPQNISWAATESTADTHQNATAMLLNFWDPADKAALRVDLWTKEMMVDEMTDFYYQTFLSMAETFQRSTGQTELVNDIKTFATSFLKKFQASQLANNK